jgi:glycine hydroxymethyltransferase
MNLLPGEPGKNAMDPKGIRLGVQEMTRTGMGAGEMEEIARLLGDVIVDRKAVKDDVHRLRERFPTVRYGTEAKDLV